MIILELEQIEIDYCISCEGIWLDSDELELLLDDEEAYLRVIAAGELLTETTEKKRKCPLCRKKMNKIQVGTETKITYDACPLGEGIWLDKGELEAVIKVGLPDQEGMEIQRFFSHLFQNPNPDDSNEPQ
jgi:hypothetical protein